MCINYNNSDSNLHFLYTVIRNFIYLLCKHYMAHKYLYFYVYRHIFPLLSVVSVVMRAAKCHPFLLYLCLSLHCIKGYAGSKASCLSFVIISVRAGTEI